MGKNTTKLTITLSPNGGVSVTGPIDNAMLCYGLFGGGEGRGQDARAEEGREWDSNTADCDAREWRGGVKPIGRDLCMTISIPITGSGPTYGLSEQAVRFAGEAEIELMRRLVDAVVGPPDHLTRGERTSSTIH